MSISSRSDKKGGFRRVRFIILAISVFYLAFLQSSVMTFNTAYVVLSNETSSPLFNQYQLGATAALLNMNQFDWSPTYLPLALHRFPLDGLQRSFTFAASFAGGLLGTFPMLYVLKHVGAHVTMSIVGIASCILCALTPVTIAASFELFVGFLAAPIFPVIGTVIEDWAPMEEKGLFVAILSAHVELDTLFTPPVGSLIAEKVNWPTVFYVQALVCAFFTVGWMYFYRDDPGEHFMITRDEVDMIHRGKTKDHLMSPPYRAIFTSLSIWAVFISAIGTIFVGQFMDVFSPQYFTSVLGYSPTITGTLTIIPTIALLPLKAIAGIASDKITRISELAKLRIFNSLACFLGAAFFVVIILVPPSTNSAAATALIMMPFILLAFLSGGFHKAAVMISRQHSSFVYSIVHIFSMLALICSTFTIPLLTPEETFEQWRIVFIIFIAVLTISNIFFIIFVKAEPAEWAHVSNTNEFVQLTEEPRPKHQLRQ
ncbi:hypothetical protein PRIPAC_80974 [Pristionchus pacificus]|uniref:Membrane transporter n=1 Tax=Pristionchus pacificus TaxID=54126 RepID=A0A2A6BH64_PRIPA|nr:hypothetical protein PRIPAC_80974 [Pristionchus pacificus]|eukprot:PDM65265.1 membrane transporter [Pristionchus pacificus]